MKDIYQYVYNSIEGNISIDQQISLMEAIKKLPDNNRQVIEYHFIEKMSRKSIADLLQCSVSKVNSNLTRGISLLKWKCNPAAFEKAKEIFKEKIKNDVRHYLTH